MTAHRFLTRAIRTARAPSLPLGVFGGLSGLALATSALRRRQTCYQRLQAALDESLVSGVSSLAQATRRAEGGIAVSRFDAISGLSGVGAYLLRRRECPGADAALKTALSALVDLVARGGGVPRWRTPPTLEYPTGSLNCGLAHGIPGPLALMALASREGVEVPGQRGAIRDVCDWLVENRVDDPWGVNWPRVVPMGLSGGEGPDRAPPRPSRSAWCYGSPGVARALWLASEALADAALCSLALQAMEAVYRRPAAERNVDSPTFCHGIAGLLQITLRFAHDSGLSMFACAGRELVEQLLRAHRPDRLLGFPSVEPGGNLVDRPGVLDGAIGVAMVPVGSRARRRAHMGSPIPARVSRTSRLGCGGAYLSIRGEQARDHPLQALSPV